MTPYIWPMPSGQIASCSHTIIVIRNLHNLVVQAKGHHSGVLIVRKHNDPTRDLKPAGVVRAIRNLEQAAVPLKDEYHILNHWR